MAAQTILFANNAKSTLASALSNVGTTMTLAPGTGALFPNPTPGTNYFVMTISDAATNLLREIIWVTARSGDVCTIVRAKEGTSAAAWTAGDLANNRLTAGQMSAMGQIGVELRTLAQGNLTFYVATTGSDTTGDGTISLPWATRQYAYNFIQRNYDLGGQYTATINVADGTYNDGLTANGPIAGQTNPIVFVGNVTTPANVVINAPGGSPNCFGTQGGAKISCKGFKVTTGTGSGVIASDSGSMLNYDQIDFGACGFSHVNATNGGSVALFGSGTNYISGNAPSHLWSQFVAFLNCINGTIIFRANVSFSQSFTYSGRCSAIYAPAMTFTMNAFSATGPRYLVQLNAEIETGNAGANYFPGNSAGSVATGGQYF